MSATSLWPDFKIEARPRGMKQILLDAGGDLPDKTNGLIQFVVQVHQSTKGFAYECALAVRDTKYKVELFTVWTDYAGFPADLYAPDGTQITAIHNESELREHLVKIFQSGRTKEVILNLVANFG